MADRQETLWHLNVLGGRNPSDPQVALEATVDGSTLEPSMGFLVASDPQATHHMLFPSGRCRARTDDLLVVSQHKVVRVRSHTVRGCLIYAFYWDVLARAAGQTRTGRDGFGHDCWVKNWVDRFVTGAIST